MANKRAVTYLLSINDDMSTMVKKINSALRSINQDITVTNVTKTSGSTTVHNDLSGRIGVADCHDIAAISELEAKLNNIDTKFSEIDTIIETINTDISTIKKKITVIEAELEDHEERISRLEGE